MRTITVSSNAANMIKQFVGITNADGVTVSNNTIDIVHMRFLYFSSATYGTVVNGNVINKAWGGIQINGGGKHVVTNNSLTGYTGNLGGNFIQVWNCDGANISGNMFGGIAPYPAKAIYTFNANKVRAVNNIALGSFTSEVYTAGSGTDVVYSGNAIP